MRTFDFTPLYKSAVGFDRLANLLEAANVYEQSQPGYPPYNIELTGEHKYRISMAVAGFSAAEMDIEVDQGVLKVSGKKSSAEEEKRYLHQGIAARNFERKFQLEDYVKVVGAELKDGLLHIELIREIPEAKKPRKIEIAGTESQLESLDDKPQLADKTSVEANANGGQEAKDTQAA